MISSSFLFYLLPLLVMILAVIVLNNILPTALEDDWLPLIAIAVLLVTFRMIHCFQSQILFYFHVKPQIIAKV